MISIIIAFRFSGVFSERKFSIERTFHYWSLMKDLHNIELVFVNDHSQNFEFEAGFIYDFPGKKVPWNQAAARNFGASLATGDKMLFTDIDHILYGDFQKLDILSFDKEYITFPRRIIVNEKKCLIHPHVNTFLLNSKHFTYFDEDFCGNYGYEDIEFLYRLRKTHIRTHYNGSLFSYMTNLRSSDDSRDSTVNAELFKRKTKY